MGEFVTIVGLVLLGAVVFVFWLAITIGRLIISAIFGIGRRKPSRVSHGDHDHTACRNPGCRAMNSIYARFCKRCGKSTGTAAPAPMRYVA